MQVPTVLQVTVLTTGSRLDNSQQPTTDENTIQK
jgi:hypothetical protein